MLLQAAFELVFLLATLAAVATSQQSISPTPTVPAGITGATEVSSVLATATLAPDLGNPANILTYPRCAVILLYLFLPENLYG